MRDGSPTEGWERNLAAIWFAQTASQMGFSFILPFIPLYVQVLGVRDAVEAVRWAGAIAAASAVSMTIAQPIWGVVADRWGRKPMVIRSMVGGSLIISLMAFVTSPEQLLVLRFVQGSVTGVVAAATALIATSTPRHRMGFALGLNQVAMFAGASVGPLIGGVIADNLGYRASFLASGALLMVGGLIVVFFVRERFTRPGAAGPRQSILSQSRALLSNGVLSMMVAIIFLINLASLVVSPVLSIFIAELSRNVNAATAAGGVLAATGAASAAAAVVIGRLSDRVGHGRILVICLVGATVTYLPQAAVTDVWQLLALRLLLGLFLGGLMPGANALVASVVPEQRRGVAYGLTGTASALAHGIGPASGAAIASAWGLRAVFVATSVLFALAATFIGLGLRRAGHLSSRDGQGTASRSGQEPKPVVHRR